MLVKFLSFIASVLSNARYKAVLIPSIILVLAITGLTTIAVVHDGSPRSAASTAEKTAGGSDSQPSKAPQVSGQQNPKEEPAPSAPEPSQPGGGTSQNDSNNSAGKPAQAAAEIVLAPSTFSVAQGTSTSATAMATLSDNSAASWSIMPEIDSNTLQVLVANENPRSASSSLSFRFQASQDAPLGRYQFTLRAKDSARGLDISREITVTVTSHIPSRPN